AYSGAASSSAPRAAVAATNTARIVSLDMGTLPVGCMKYTRYLLMVRGARRCISCTLLMVEQKFTAAHQAPEDVLGDLRLKRCTGSREQFEQVLPLGLGRVAREAGEVDFVDQGLSRHAFAAQP